MQNRQQGSFVEHVCNICALTAPEMPLNENMKPLFNTSVTHFITMFTIYKSILYIIILPMIYFYLLCCTVLTCYVQV